MTSHATAPPTKPAGPSAPFGISPHALASLARTAATARDVRLLRDGLHSRRLVLLKSLLTRADRHAVPQTVRQRLDEHWQLLERAEADDPLAAREALAYPAIGNWLMHLLGLTDEDAFAAALDGLGAVAAAVALRTGTSFRITLDAPGGRLALPGLGLYEAGARVRRVRAVAGPRSLRLTPEGRRGGVVLRAPHLSAGQARGAGWHGLRQLAAGSPGVPRQGAGPVLDDVDPFRAGPQAAERHRSPAGPRTPAGPERPVADAGVGGGAGGAVRHAGPEDRARGWPARWGAALILLESADPARAAEVSALVRAVVPLSRGPQAATSATLRCAPGGLLVGLPASATELAATLVHEVQHSKLAVLTDLMPLIRDDGPAVHRVAWRPDPRPLGAVLHGTYAHLALADLWHRLAERRGATPALRGAARERGERYRAQVGPALATLRESGELTAAGAAFTEGMRRHHADLARRHARWRLSTGRLTSPGGDVE